MAASKVRWVVVYHWPDDTQMEVELCPDWWDCHRVVLELRAAGFEARPIRVWSDRLGDLRYTHAPGSHESL